jgi:peptide-N4-(N-acetyl-beta-glucosaminyl)asparagine amidase
MSITQRFLKAQEAKKGKASPQPTFGPDDMESLLRFQMAEFRKYTREEALEAARAAMPVDRFHEEVLAEMKPGDDFFPCLAKKAMAWFKHDFFSWVNVPPCDFCGAEPGQMKALDMTPPTPEELKYGARRVELYQCGVCESFSRFPRYNDPVKLLESRRGRCGEWANCFCLCLKALGFNARYVLDSTDHVWAEIWVDEPVDAASEDPRGRYVHMDPCENAWDTPLVYEKGWGKKLSYIFAFTERTATDVIKKYSRNWDDVVTRRTKCGEEHLTSVITRLNKESLAGVADAEQILLRRKSDKDNMTASFLAGDTGKEEESIGRVSGSVEWRLARGEMGEGSSEANQGSCPEPEGMNLLFDIPTRSSEDESGVMVAVNGAASFSRLRGPTPFSDTPVFSIELTDAVSDQCGSTFAIPQLPLDKTFLIEFGFRITNAKGGPGRGGADGLAFVLHGDDDAGPLALGGKGFELGYGGMKACLAVEFDTYGEFLFGNEFTSQTDCYACFAESRDHAQDPNDNHISIMSTQDPSLPLHAHHKFALQTATKLPQMNDGTLYFSKIFFDAENTIFSVWLSDSSEDPNTCAIEGDEQCGPFGAASLSEQRELKLRGQDYIRVLSLKVDLKRSLGEVEGAYAGFTAATGGLSQRHEICGWRMYVSK